MWLLRGLVALLLGRRSGQMVRLSHCLDAVSPGCVIDLWSGRARVHRKWALIFDSHMHAVIRPFMHQSINAFVH